MTKTIVTLPAHGDRRFKSWAKHVIHVDTDEKGGYAFEGIFLNTGRKVELPIGAVVILFGMYGSRAKAEPQVIVVQVSAEYSGEGYVSELFRADGWDWALDLRDRVSDLLAEPPADNPLAGYSTPELFEELRRRGLA